MSYHNIKIMSDVDNDEFVSSESHEQNDDYVYDSDDVYDDDNYKNMTLSELHAINASLETELDKLCELKGNIKWELKKISFAISNKDGTVTKNILKDIIDDFKEYCRPVDKPYCDSIDIDEVSKGIVRIKINDDVDIDRCGYLGQGMIEYKVKYDCSHTNGQCKLSHRFRKNIHKFRMMHDIGYGWNGLGWYGPLEKIPSINSFVDNVCEIEDEHIIKYLLS